MKTLLEVRHQIRDIIKDNPELSKRIKALQEAGYQPEYLYIKKGNDIYDISYLKKKKQYRIIVSHTELQKGYPAAFNIDCAEVNRFEDLRFRSITI